MHGHNKLAISDEGCKKFKQSLNKRLLQRFGRFFGYKDGTGKVFREVAHTHSNFPYNSPNKRFYFFDQCLNKGMFGSIGNGHISCIKRRHTSVRKISLKRAIKMFLVKSRKLGR